MQLRTLRDFHRKEFCDSSFTFPSGKQFIAMEGTLHEASELLGVLSISARYQLCELRQVTISLNLSVHLSVTGEK